MKETKIRTYRIDGDTLEVLFELHETCGVWIGNYPYFEEEPRYTPNGRLWKNVTYDGCPHADPVYKDCGTCPHLNKEQPKDLIGVCFHEEMRRRG